MKALLTRKVGMTSAINDDGSVSAITLLSVDENVITQIKHTEHDGYNAAQVATGTKKGLAKAQVGHFKAVKMNPAIVREIRLNDTSEELNVGDKLNADVFSVGDVVNVIGTTKGKGFAGTIRRHGFHRGRKTHGGGSYRRPGSIGSMYPQRIFRGKKMAGRLGHVQVTTRNLKVAIVDVDKQVIGVIGSVPGPRKSLVIVRGKSEA